MKASRIAFARYSRNVRRKERMYLRIIHMFEHCKACVSHFQHTHTYICVCDLVANDEKSDNKRARQHIDIGGSVGQIRAHRIYG